MLIRCAGNIFSQICLINGISKKSWSNTSVKNQQINRYYQKFPDNLIFKNDQSDKIYQNNTIY